MKDAAFPPKRRCGIFFYSVKIRTLSQICVLKKRKMCSNCALQSHRLQTVHAFYVVGKIHKAYRLSAVFVVDNHTHGNALGNARPSVLSHTSKREKTDLNRAVPLCILLFFCAFLQEKRGYPTPENTILHPILHRKSSVNTGSFIVWCRKCRMFFQNFFQRERRDSGPGGKGCSIN